MSIPIGGLARCWVCDAEAVVQAGPDDAILAPHMEAPRVIPDDGKPRPMCPGGGKTRLEQWDIVIQRAKDGR